MQPQCACIAEMYSHAKENNAMQACTEDLHKQMIADLSVLQRSFDASVEGKFMPHLQGLQPPQIPQGLGPPCPPALPADGQQGQPPAFHGFPSALHNSRGQAPGPPQHQDCDEGPSSSQRPCQTLQGRYSRHLPGKLLRCAARVSMSRPAFEMA